MPLSSAAPLIVFGAFDRHNFGDLLFPHIVSALLQEHSLIFAGLLERDLRSYGGHQVHALPALLEHWQGEAPIILHAGGELLGCDAWEAAVMLQPEHEAQEVIKQWDKSRNEKQEWATRHLKMRGIVPYMVEPTSLPTGAGIVYNAVGGVDLATKSAAMRQEVLAKLAAADALGVRDEVTLRQVSGANKHARLLPDPAALTAELYDSQIAARAGQGEVAELISAFPDGYLAVQCSTDFGDDATLETIVEQLSKIIRETGYKLVLFRAGAAPWHDDLGTYVRIAKRFSDDELRICHSLFIWDICAVLANSRGYCGGSLHGRIVAMAYALPRLNLVHPLPFQRMGKQAAYADSWDSRSIPAVVPPCGLYAGMMQALSLPQSERQQIAAQCALAYRQGFAALCKSADI